MRPSILALACAAIVLTSTLVVSDAAARAPDGFWDKVLRGYAAEDARSALPKGAIVFVGSSSIRLWPTGSSFPVLPTRNRGLSGAQIDDVNHFVDRLVLAYEPKVVVFYAGENDIGGGATSDRVLADYRTFVGRVQSKLPTARIIFISIKPSPVLQAQWAKAKDANRLISAYSDTDNRLRYVDVATPMLAANGKPRRELFGDDGLHMNTAGYRLWTSLLTPVIESAFAEP